MTLINLSSFSLVIFLPLIVRNNRGILPNISSSMNSFGSLPDPAAAKSKNSYHSSEPFLSFRSLAYFFNISSLGGDNIPRSSLLILPASNPCFSQKERSVKPSAILFCLKKLPNVLDSSILPSFYCYNRIIPYCNYFTTYIL